MSAVWHIWRRVLQVTLRAPIVYVIGGLFLVYGVMLTVAGFFTSDEQRAKASDININLWLGLGMLLVGVIFLVWRRLNPVRPEPNPTDEAGAARETEAQSKARSKARNQARDRR